ncbi:unnamed protein product [Albugo candida]|uniref:Uncharacterized protein n=1 Tax=Albugo candida TaxID=65357 RepID=A0A024GNC6_9STRA|nr:unnamed protein product [Albugo candida]|eukprot:CCI48288.1 unnamed protein product [Albugo candida]
MQNIRVLPEPLRAYSAPQISPNSTWMCLCMHTLNASSTACCPSIPSVFFLSRLFFATRYPETGFIVQKSLLCRLIDREDLSAFPCLVLDGMRTRAERDIRRQYRSFDDGELISAYRYDIIIAKGYQIECILGCCYQVKQIIV